MNTPYTQVSANAPEPEFQLTVITVCWNALPDLKPTVESVLRQKAKGSLSIEHVVVDGASADGTPEWLAGQLAAGNIERYVSEPDRGIYDAMNKGINLARGQVLAFMNAGDSYTDEDLAPCVLPICRGETQSVAARARMGKDLASVFEPVPGRIFFHCPYCHQAYFASAALYRELGGYAAEIFKCSGDTDFMYRQHRASGQSLVLNSIVANFTPGGISSNCDDDFRHEHVEHLWRNWNAIEQKCREDKDFAAAMAANVADHCYEFRNWQERHGLMIPGCLRKLQSMCLSMAALARQRRTRYALKMLGRLYLPGLVQGKTASRLMARMARIGAHFCNIQPGNAYEDYAHIPPKPLVNNPILKRLHRAVHR